MSIHLIRFLRWWHERWGHPHSLQVRTPTAPPVTIGLLCTCGQVMRVEGVIIRVVQHTIIEVDDQQPTNPTPVPPRRKKAHKH